MFFVCFSYIRKLIIYVASLNKYKVYTQTHPNHATQCLKFCVSWNSVLLLVKQNKLFFYIGDPISIGQRLAGQI